MAFCFGRFPIYYLPNQTIRGYEPFTGYDCVGLLCKYKKGT